jgi:hypothetical protein
MENGIFDLPLSAQNPVQDMWPVYQNLNVSAESISSMATAECRQNPSEPPKRKQKQKRN